MNFVMGDKPSAFGKMGMPVTAITDNLIILNPIIDAGPMSFTGTKNVTINSNQANVSYFYTSLP